MALHIGDSRTVRTIFRDIDGVSQWPATVTSTVRRPDGTVTTVSNSQVTIADLDGESNVKAVEATLPTFDQAGVWEWRQAGSVGVTDADQGLLVVEYEGAVAAV